MWKDYDADGSGSLEFNEVKLMMENLYKEMGLKPFSQIEFGIMYKKIDKDGSGTLDKEEMVNFFMELTK